MIVSWEWLREYVALDVPLEDFLGRLTMAGLNVESKHQVGDDWAIDVEVTSNRPDCLGHIGIAREAAVLFGRPLKVPDPNPKSAGGKTAEVTSVVVECPDLCPRYFARRDSRREDRAESGLAAAIGWRRSASRRSTTSSTSRTTC